MVTKLCGICKEGERLKTALRWNEQVKTLIKEKRFYFARMAKEWEFKVKRIRPRKKELRKLWLWQKKWKVRKLLIN